MLNPNQRPTDPVLIQVTEALELALGAFNDAYFGRPIPDDATSAVETALFVLENLPPTTTIQQTPAHLPGSRQP